MNKANLIGRLTKDPELRYLPETGTAMCRFTIAVDRGMSKDQKHKAEAAGKPTADFIGIIAWGKTAEFAANYLTKGLQVGISGRIQTSSRVADDRSRRYGTDILAEQIHMIEWKNNQGNNDYGLEGFYPADNEDIPF